MKPTRHSSRKPHGRPGAPAHKPGSGVRPVHAKAAQPPAATPRPAPGPRPVPPDPNRGPVWVPPSPLPEPLKPTPEFLAGTESIGIAFDPGDIEKFGLFLAILLHANESLNLTGVRDPAECWTKHIADSLTLMAVLADLPEGARVIDVGSGAGLPGIPLAIAMPTLKFTLLEATGKKADFLRHAVSILNLPNVTVLNQRAETAGRDRGKRQPMGAGFIRVDPHRESYDAAVARAVGPMSVIAELTVPFVKLNGRVLLIKGQRAAEELVDAAEALRALHAVHSGTIETPTGRIVVLAKPSLTPRDYPRNDGEPKRSPLGAGKRGSP